MASYCQVLPRMSDLKRRIDALCAKVIAAPDGSEELTITMRELRSALAEHSENLRRYLEKFRQKGVPQSSDPPEG